MEYNSRTGILTVNGVDYIGYSGLAPYQDNPIFQAIRGIGPAPEGTFTLTLRDNSGYVPPLQPGDLGYEPPPGPGEEGHDPDFNPWWEYRFDFTGNNLALYNRDAIQIHIGNSNHTGSTGCVAVSPAENTPPNTIPWTDVIRIVYGAFQAGDRTINVTNGYTGAVSDALNGLSIELSNQYFENGINATERAKFMAVQNLLDAFQEEGSGTLADGFLDQFRQVIVADADSMSTANIENLAGNLSTLIINTSINVDLFAAQFTVFTQEGLQGSVISEFGKMLTDPNASFNADDLLSESLSVISALMNAFDVAEAACPAEIGWLVDLVRDEAYEAINSGNASMTQLAWLTGKMNELASIFPDLDAEEIAQTQADRSEIEAYMADFDQRLRGDAAAENHEAAEGQAYNNAMDGDEHAYDAAVTLASVNDKSGPIVLDLDGDGLETYDIADSNAYFDYTGDDFATKTAWLSGGDGFLTIDVNGNGDIDNINELIGNDSQSGFSILTFFDSNQDGVIDANDDYFDQLLIWRDANEDGIGQFWELSTLAENNIAKIYLDPVVDGSTPSDDVTIALHGTFERTDGTIGDTYEVTFKDAPNVSKYIGDVEIDNEIEAAINLRGSGRLPDLHQAMALDPALKSMVIAATDNIENIDPSSIKGVVEQILYRWAGVDSMTLADVDPTARLTADANGNVEFTNAGVTLSVQQLAVIKAYCGMDELKIGDGVWESAPGVYETTGENYQAVWDYIVSKMFTRVIVQTSLLDDTLSEIYYDPYTDLINTKDSLLLDMGERVQNSLDEISSGNLDYNEMYYRALGIDMISELLSEQTISVQYHDDGKVDISVIGDSFMFSGGNQHFVIAGDADDNIEMPYVFQDGDNSYAYQLNYVNAGDGNNTVIMEYGEYKIKTGDGDDFIYRAPGFVSDESIVIDAGAGENRIVTDVGADDGDDIINAGAGVDTIYAGNGVDTIISGEGHDIIDLGGGDDVFTELDGSNTIICNAGNNTVTTGDYDDIITTGSGNDIIDAGEGNNTVTLNQGNDEITLGAGNDRVYGYTTASGDKIVNAGDGNNIIETGKGADTVIAGSGDDNITTYGRYGDQGDIVDAGEGNNTIRTGGGDDNITAGSGDDTIIAGDGDDVINVGGGTNSVYGGAGDDMIAAIEGTLWGDSGSDTYIQSNGTGDLTIINNASNDAAENDIMTLANNASRCIPSEQVGPL